VVDVEQRALRAFEQQVARRAGGPGTAVAHVGHHRLDLLGHLHGMSRSAGTPAASLPAAAERGVVQRQQFAQLGLAKRSGCFRSCTRSARRATLSS
jgi:hypothetical protein